MAKKILGATKRYEFRTFALGLSMPSGMQETEDEIRSALKIKGGETVKIQLSGRISGEFSKLTGKRLERETPDLMVVFDLRSFSVEVASKPIFYHARYTKPGGVAQKRELCQVCFGRGCDACGNTGYEREASVEGALRKRLAKAGGKMTFTWMGSEDKSSRVFPPGRPVVIEVKNPFKRKLPSKFALRTGAGLVKVSGGTVLKSRPTALPRFRFRTLIYAEVDGRVTPTDLVELRRRFKNAEVRFDRLHGRQVVKKVYRVAASGRGGRLTIDAELDGGLPVKRFVNGDLVSPSVAEVLKKEVACRRFDIYRVTETGGFRFG